MKTNMSNRRRMFGVWLAAVLLSWGCLTLPVACSSNAETVDESGSIALMGGNAYSIDGEGGSVNIRFTATGRWSVTIPSEASEWVSCDPMSGGASGGRQTITITAKKNDGDARTAKLTLASGSDAPAITVSQEEAVVTFEGDIEDEDKIFIPAEFANMDLRKSSSTWYWGRSRQSEHFILFWAKGYGSTGATTPKDLAPTNSMYVDIDDLLVKAEQFYDVNVNTLKFIDPSTGNSCVNKYKMMILLYYQTEWLATGSGYDNAIGALWVNPSTCQPVGSVIAHEIGHCFQYMVYVDQLLAGRQDDLKSGWRYGYGLNGEGGNAFWEQCAQWQSFQTYKDEAFSGYYFDEYISSTHLHTMHEDPRYANYFIQWWWTQQHGIDCLGRLWRESAYPEDPNETYMRLYGLTIDDFNDEMWQHAAHMVTWDIDEIRQYGKNYIGAQAVWNYVADDDGYYRVPVATAPESTGYNVIRLNTPEAGTTVTVDFQGLTNVSGYNCGSASKAGWRYGFVAYNKTDGTTHYSDCFSESNGTGSYTVPAGCESLWLVVTGAPNQYERHLWDDNNTNDVKWPYQVKFTGTSLYGTVAFDGTETRHDETFTYDLTIPYDASGYGGASVNVDIVKLAKAFVLQPSVIARNLKSGTVKFVGLNADGSQYAGYTANNYGHWFDAAGNVCAWGDENARVFSEFDETNWRFSIGQYPARCEGQSFTVRQAMIYQGTTVTFEFNITIR